MLLGLAAIALVVVWWKYVYGVLPPRAESTLVAPDSSGSEESAWGAIEPRSAHLDHGVLVVSNTREHPVWWSPSLADDATIDLDVTMEGAPGEISIEAWADGQTSGTGYRFHFTGSSATSGIIRQGGARQGAVDVAFPERPGEAHHWRIIRKGGEIAWLIDGKPFAAVIDPSPLVGQRHASLGIEAGDAPVRIAHLRVTRP